ncbi:Flavorubredoxin [Desulfonispora thiosulfatigenes DSM 11270]|uniref:Flavorubredoxin n=1 Tax=Desulfonispora thiosulfatigenes DSM 11270 TaxID=656914 RepID=A0A1W1VCU5_DESTI|nr:flavodoxin domain-containing protein [Desulfonispora thiosulfatigenes]SMB91267.1 Flavorubredoxin [Desulfonispora thiosulfatigenes DSM 11270]
MEKLRENIYRVGTTDWELRHFHGFELSTHRGSTYNSYLIKDEKTVLLDTVWAPLTERYIENLQKLVDVSTIDYLIINHAEPDHSGAIAKVMELAPNATIVVSPKGEESVKRYFHNHQNWKFQVVKTGDKINIGKNELIFVEAPMLHWPDSMFTYLTGENILFSNDAFGQHYATSEIYNDQVDQDELYQEALKYYANILTPFSKLVTKKLDEVVALNLPLEMIAPAHGVIWRENPGQIIEKYYEWASGKTEKRVTIIYSSMWHSTQKMAVAIAQGLEEVGVSYKMFNMGNSDTNDVITEIFKSKGLIAGCSTVNNGVLPSIMPIIEEIKGFKFANKIAATFGSYGWSGESPKVLAKYLEDAKFKIVQDSIKYKYKPTEEDLKECIEFGKQFGEKIKED